MRRVLHSSSLDIRHQLFHARQVRHSCEERRSDEVPPRSTRACRHRAPDFCADLAPTYARYFGVGTSERTGRKFLNRKQHRTRDSRIPPMICC